MYGQNYSFHRLTVVAAHTFCFFRLFSRYRCLTKTTVGGAYRFVCKARPRRAYSDISEV